MVFVECVFPLDLLLDRLLMDPFAVLLVTSPGPPAPVRFLGVESVAAFLSIVAQILLAFRLFSSCVGSSYLPFLLVQLGGKGCHLTLEIFLIISASNQTMYLRFFGVTTHSSLSGVRREK